jgi:hypothetical protein
MCWAGRAMPDKMTVVWGEKFFTARAACAKILCQGHGSQIADKRQLF